MQRSRNSGVVGTQQKQLFRCATNISLLVSGIVMTFSGLYIQVRYHIPGNFSLEFSRWTFIHQWAALSFTLAVITHMLLHLNWYKVVFKRRLLRKNRVTLILTVSLFVVSLLGFVPWTVSLFLPHLELRHTLVEIHDKVGVGFAMIMIGHLIKRGKWYIRMWQFWETTI